MKKIRSAFALITPRRWLFWCFCSLALTLIIEPSATCRAAGIPVPNGSFESPSVPAVSPYAAPDIDNWQKSPQPAWYDPAQNSNTPWTYLMGEFYNVPFPGQFIENCDGTQAAFLFALPDAALFQDYGSIYGTNTNPDHLFAAKFYAGSSYDLTVGVLGGGGGMKAGTTLEIQLYYVGASSNNVVASTSITNDASRFPTNTQFVDFTAHVPAVKSTDAWAGQYVGIRVASTVGFDLSGGYWDLDNVRLVETGTPMLTAASVTNGLLSVTVNSGPGAQFELQRTTNLASTASWVSVVSYTNTTGAVVFQDGTSNSRSFYRVRRF